MTSLRLIADDLTGALDTAAEFVGLSGPVPVYWAGSIPAELPPSAALDSGTREASESEAIAVVTALAARLGSAAIPYKKVDSLLRGHSLAEVAACFRLGAWKKCVLAPAFPYQGRVTRAGRQFAKGPEGDWCPVSGDLVAELAAQGVDAAAGRAGSGLQDGISVFDVVADADLDRVVEAGRRVEGSVLWCGSGGLARALARGTDPNPSWTLLPPVLGLFGSDQGTTTRQLAACGPLWIRVPDGGPESAAEIGRLLDRTGAALASFDLPPGLGRCEAAARIGRAMEALTSRLPRPRTLIVAGGETLRALCVALGAEALEVRGQVVPGVPRSLLRGGRWGGIEVVSKSGAFGEPHLWRDLLDRNGFAARTDT